MYNNGTLASTGAGAAATSILLDSVWVFLASFAILAALLAVARILPRR
ncbi:hypothetical protein [Nocardioides sp.]